MWIWSVSYCRSNQTLWTLLCPVKIPPSCPHQQQTVCSGLRETLSWSVLSQPKANFIPINCLSLPGFNTVSRWQGKLACRLCSSQCPTIHTCDMPGQLICTLAGRSYCIQSFIGRNYQRTHLIPLYQPPCMEEIQNENPCNLRLPLKCPHFKLGLLNFCPLHLHCWCSTDIFTLSHSAVDSPKPQVVPSLLLVELGAEPSLLLIHVHEISDLQFSLVILNYILNYNKFFCLVIHWLLSALLIYLFIYSFNFLWAVQLHFTNLL